MKRKENINQTEGGKMKYSVIWIRSEEHWEDMDIEGRREALKITTFTSKNMARGYRQGIMEDIDVQIVTIGKGIPTKNWLDGLSKQDTI